jgi:GT2 family glycosyltransferase
VRATGLEIVVVAYHGAPDLERCLQRVGGAHSITVVDNSRSDQVRSVVERARARYVDAGGNIGFARAVNLALRRVLAGEPADVLLVNPDAQIAGSDIDELQHFLRAYGNERFAAVSPSLTGQDGTEQRAAWPFPTPWGGIVDAFGLGRLLARSQKSHGYVIGAVLLLRWEALRQVGLFDERFFLYAEEADWQRRAAAHRWRSVVYPGVRATHVGAATSSDAAARETLFHAAHETYIRKWHGRWGWLVYRTAAVVGAMVRTVVLPGERKAVALRRAGLYARGPRRAAGFS